MTGPMSPPGALLLSLLVLLGLCACPSTAYIPAPIHFAPSNNGTVPSLHGSCFPYWFRPPNSTFMGYNVTMDQATGQDPPYTRPLANSQDVWGDFEPKALLPNSTLVFNKTGASFLLSWVLGNGSIRLVGGQAVGGWKAFSKNFSLALNGPSGPGAISRSYSLASGTHKMFMFRWGSEPTAAGGTPFQFTLAVDNRTLLTRTITPTPFPNSTAVRWKVWNSTFMSPLNRTSVATFTWRSLVPGPGPGPVLDLFELWSIQPPMAPNLLVNWGFECPFWDSFTLRKMFNVGPGLVNEAYTPYNWTINRGALNIIYGEYTAPDPRFALVLLKNTSITQIVQGTKIGAKYELLFDYSGYAARVCDNQCCTSQCPIPFCNVTCASCPNKCNKNTSIQVIITSGVEYNFTYSHRAVEYAYILNTGWNLWVTKSAVFTAQASVTNITFYSLNYTVNLDDLKLRKIPVEWPSKDARDSACSCGNTVLGKCNTVDGKCYGTGFRA